MYVEFLAQPSSSPGRSSMPGLHRKSASLLYILGALYQSCYLSVQYQTCYIVILRPVRLSLLIYADYGLGR